jgi:hypothetical protein
METYKIYIFGIVGLALALSVLSFHLLSDRKKKKVVQVKLLTLVYIYVFFFMIVFMLLIMVEFYKGPQIMLSNNDNFQLVIKEQVKFRFVDDVASEDSTVYQDPGKDFYLELPVSPGWQEAKVRNGLRAYLEKAGLETGKTNVESFIKWNPYSGVLSCILNDISVRPYDQMMGCLSKTLLQSLSGQILRSSSSTVFEYGSPITVQISPEFKTPLTSLLLTQDEVVLDSLNDSSVTDSVEAPNYVDLSFVNYLSVSVLDKSKSTLDDGQVSMANYFLKNTINLSSNAEKMIAKENLMFFTSSFDFEKARFNGEIKDFRVHRWVRMIEEPLKLFIVEMAYCPGTDENGVIWKDQKLMFESFGLLTE